MGEKIEDAENTAWYAAVESLKNFKVGDELKIDKLDFINKFREYLGLEERKVLDKGKDPIEWLKEQ